MRGAGTPAGWSAVGGAAAAWLPLCLSHPKDTPVEDEGFLLEIDLAAHSY